MKKNTDTPNQVAPYTTTLNAALEHVFVRECDPDDSPYLRGWYGVGTDDAGLIAYFYTEREALRHRLDLINRILNG